MKAVKFILVGLMLVSAVACNKSKKRIVGTYTDVMNNDYVVQIEKSKDGFLVKFPRGEERTANFVSQCDDEKLSIYYKAYSYSSIEDCKRYEKGYEQAGGGTLIIGMGGEWVKILTSADVSDLARDKRFKAHPEDDDNNMSNIYYNREHVAYQNAYGQLSVWRKYSKEFEN